MFEQLEDFNLSQGCDGELERRKRGRGLRAQETRPPLPGEQERCDRSSLAGDLLEQHHDKSLKGNQRFKTEHQQWDCQNVFTIRPPLAREILPRDRGVWLVPRPAHRHPSLLSSPCMFVTRHGTAQFELQCSLPSCCLHCLCCSSLLSLSHLCTPLSMCLSHITQFLHEQQPVWSPAPGVMGFCTGGGTREQCHLPGMGSIASQHPSRTAQSPHSYCTTLLPPAFAAEKVITGRTLWQGNHKTQRYHSISRTGKRPQGWDPVHTLTGSRSGTL